MLDLVTLAIFVFVMCVAWLVARTLLRPRTTGMAVPSGPGRSALSVYEDSSSPVLESLAGQLPQSFSVGEELDKDLRRAGYYGTYARQRYLALRNGLVVLTVLAAGGIAVAIGPKHQRAVAWTLAAGVLAAILAFAVPRVVLALRARRRVERIRGALPDALDTISMCLHGGISLQECLGYVGQEMLAVHWDLGIELLMVSQQTDINSFEFAIQQFAARIDATEVIALAALVTQNQRLGTGVVDSIRDFADNLRLKRRQTAEAKASRAELFLLFPVIFCLLPSILFLLWGPPILSIIDFFQGPASPLRINR
jgi:tight adherence protein C